MQRNTILQDCWKIKVAIILFILIVTAGFAVKRQILRNNSTDVFWFCLKIVKSLPLKQFATSLI